MDYQQIHLKAEGACGYLTDEGCVTIYVASSADNPIISGVLDSFRAEVEKNDIKAEMFSTGSFGYYDLEPIVIIKKLHKPTIFYHNITPEMTSELVTEYLVKDNPRLELALGKSGDNNLVGITNISELPLLNLQNRLTLKNCGVIDPENICEYILIDNGYRGLATALQMDRDEVIKKLKKPNLNDKETDEKYIICNAIDADPKSLTNKLLLEGVPHSVLEGFLINAYSFGATRGFICVNEEYETAVNRLELALEQMKEYNLLGDNILESGFSFDIEVREVPSSLVMKEDTALVRCLSGKQPIPYLLTVPLIDKGLSDMPTLITNAEVLSRLSATFQNDKAPHTRIVTLCGDINHEYTVEVPRDITFRQIIDDIGGSTSSGKAIKAILAGGPNGRFLSPDVSEKPLGNVSEDSPGIIEVFGGDSSVVETTRDVMAYLQSQSCGKCVFCREGTYQISDILDDIITGKAAPDDLELIQKLCEGMKQGSICGLGKKAADPVLSSLELFRADYDMHLKKRQ